MNDRIEYKFTTEDPAVKERVSELCDTLVNKLLTLDGWAYVKDDIGFPIGFKDKFNLTREQFKSYWVTFWQVLDEQKTKVFQESDGTWVRFETLLSDSDRVHVHAMLYTYQWRLETINGKVVRGTVVNTFNLNVHKRVIDKPTYSIKKAKFPKLIYLHNQNKNIWDELGAEALRYKPTWNKKFTGTYFPGLGETEKEAK